MLSSISPLGERARASRWWLTTTAYVLASTLGGVVLGLLASGTGSRFGGPVANIEAFTETRWITARSEPPTYPF